MNFGSLFSSSKSVFATRFGYRRNSISAPEKRDESRSIATSSAVRNSSWNIVGNGLKSINLKFLDVLHLRNKTKHRDTKEELDTLEAKFQEASDEKLQIANSLYAEQLQWKSKLENLAAKREELATNYFGGYVNYYAQIKETKQNVKYGKETHLSLILLDDQKIKLNKLHDEVLEVNAVYEQLKEEPQSIITLKKQFQQAKQNQFEASVAYHQKKSIYKSVDKNAQKLEALTTNIQTKNHPSVNYLAHFGSTFGIFVKQKYIEYRSLTV